MGPLQNITDFPNITFPTAETAEAIPFISDELRAWLQSLLISLMFCLGVFGTVTNLINIRVFVHQGLSSDSNTIGLFALAVADLLGCIFLIPTITCEIIDYRYGPFHGASCVSYLVFFCLNPHIAMSRITCLITVYIAVERCLCVLIPFKVKTLLQPRVTKIVMILFYVIMIGLYIPLYPFYTFTSLYYGGTNKTNVSSVPLVKMGHKDGHELVKYKSFAYNIVLSTLTYIIISIATGLMLYKLRRYSKWRSESASSGKKQENGNSTQEKQQQLATKESRKDVEILRTVLLVTILFFFCLSMSLFPGFATFYIPEFTYNGLNTNTFYIFYFYKFVFDSINSSLNFFFYVRVSSRFKAAYREVFGENMICAK